MNAASSPISCAPSPTSRRDRPLRAGGFWDGRLPFTHSRTRYFDRRPSESSGIAKEAGSQLFGRGLEPVARESLQMGAFQSARIQLRRGSAQRVLSVFQAQKIRIVALK